MNENLTAELDSLKRSDLIKILTRQNTDDIKISDELREHFNLLLSHSDGNNLCCLKCGELSKQLDLIVNDLEVCRGSITKLENELSKEGFHNEMGIKTSSSETFTLSQLESELKQFYEFCKDNKLSDEEIGNICNPLLPQIRNIHSKFFRYFLIFLLTTTLLYLLNYFEAVQWHYSAIGRIVLIELLPFWNWKQLKHEKCLIKSLSDETEPPIIQDCTFCEYINKIDVADADQADLIYKKYIKLHKPVILENGLENWMDSKSVEEVLEAILNDEILSQSMPCEFKSNIFYGSDNLYESLKGIRDSDMYFAHFQNCEFDAVKAFRKYFKRPTFLAREIMPIQYSWLLLSNNYKVEKYKQVLLRDHITVVGEFLGKNSILLHPNNCTEECETLKIELAYGEVLIFSSVWNMEYRPDSEGHNLAVVLETH